MTAWPAREFQEKWRADHGPQDALNRNPFEA
jgi:hypothetical protein